MLTAAAASVKFALPMTPEQTACSRKIDEGLKTFWNLVERMRYAADQQRPIQAAAGGATRRCRLHIHCGGDPRRAE